MSCLNALHWQIATLLSMPHEIVLLRHKVFREYAKTAIGPDFIHTLPSFLILAAAILVLWRNPPSSARLLDIVGASSSVYKGFQVSVSWLAIIALLWLWLIIQRILYCSVWHYWSYESEYRDITCPWWQRVWSSYFPVRVQPPLMSASFISWIIVMLIAITTLGCAISTNHVQTFIKETLIEARVVFEMCKSCIIRPWRRERRAIVSAEENATKDDSETSSCDDVHSEMSIEANNMARGDVHPISYGTNWMPQPNFSMFKETQRKISTKSFHTVAGDIQDHDKFGAKQLRHRRGCHTVIPCNSSEQSSEC